MGRKRTYFVLNKEQDFQRCSVKQMYFAQGRLQTELRAGDGVCALVSRIFDSGETDMQWHQFLCSMENTGKENDGGNYSQQRYGHTGSGN